MKLLLQNRQTNARARIPVIRKLIRWLIVHSSELRSLDRWNEIVLILTNDAGIKPVNRATFGKDEPTDVISLTYQGAPGGIERSTGEIFVNVERARFIGRDTRKTALELALYIAHGLHHLAGASDRTPALRRAMLNEEKAWLAQAQEAGLLKELVQF
jgi:rRNA maturation RNase YbeY